MFFLMMAASDPLFPLWLIVIIGGALSLALMVFVAWQGKGAATKSELHNEVGGLEKRVDAKFEQERTIARDAHSKIYDRMNDSAKVLNRLDAKLEEQSKTSDRMLNLMLNKKQEENL